MTKRQAEFQMYALLKQQCTIIQRFVDLEPQMAELQEQSEENMARFLEPVLRIAVIGELKRGKSTLINALLGAEILPSDITPETFVPCRIRYSIETGATICYTDGSSQDTSLEYAMQIMRRDENQGFSEWIQEVILKYPCQLLRNTEIELVDTPGLNDNAHLDSLTSKYAADADLVVIIINQTLPLSGSEADCLSAILRGGSSDRILFAANMSDRIPSPEKERVLDALRKRIAKVLAEQEEPTDSIPLYSLSALEGLQARQARNHEAYARSGCLALEHGLTRKMARLHDTGVVKRAGDCAVSLLQRAEQSCDVVQDEAAHQNAVLEELGHQLDNLLTAVCQWPEAQIVHAAAKIEVLWTFVPSMQEILRDNIGERGTDAAVSACRMCDDCFQEKLAQQWPQDLLIGICQELEDRLEIFCAELKKVVTESEYRDLLWPELDTEAEFQLPELNIGPPTVKTYGTMWLLPLKILRDPTKRRELCNERVNEVISGAVGGMKNMMQLRTKSALQQISSACSAAAAPIQARCTQIIQDNQRHTAALTQWREADPPDNLEKELAAILELF